jgi:glycosyltransferase involved in cell wall biosynthesis
LLVAEADATLAVPTTMRILHFIYDHPGNTWVGGGGARRVERIARELAGRGHQVQLICGKYPGAKASQEGNLAVEFVGTERSYVRSTLGYTAVARRLMKEKAREYDVLIEDFAPWNPVFTYRNGQRPAIVQVQNRFGAQLLKRYPVVGLGLYWLERWYPRRFAHAIVVNESLNRTMGIQGEVIPMGIEEELLSEPPRAGTYAAFLGRLDFYHKGLDLLLRAAKETGLPVRIAGFGPGEERLRRELANVPTASWVGKVSGRGKVDFLAGAKFLVVPSRFEGQPIVVSEAAGLGKAVVVSDIDEFDYVMRNGFGASFRVGNWRELAQRMRELWDEPSRLAELEGQARAYVKNLTWPKIADQFEGYCFRVIKASTGLGAG